MSSPGTLRFGQVATKPSPPPVGYDLIYVKTDDVLYIQDSAGVEVALGSASAITSLTGDVTGSGPGAAITTVNFVGGASAASIAAAAAAISTATPSNTPNTVVERDSSGNFSANVITASLNGNATTATTAVSFSGPLLGDVTGTQGATIVSFVGGSSAANVHSAELAANAATPSNTASTIVKRDASGNFSANIITASLNGNASTATTSINFSGSLSGDVTGTQGATVVSFVGGASAASVAAAASAVAAATSLDTPSTLVKRDSSGNFAAGTITANLVGNVTGNLSGNVTGGTITGLIDSIGSQRTVVLVTTNYSVPTNVDVVLVDATAGNVVLTLPSASTSNLFTFVKVDSSAHTVTIVPSGGDTISGFASVVLHNQFDTYTLGGDGVAGLGEWYIEAAIIAGTGPLTALTGDVTAIGPGSAVATVVALQGHAVSSTAPTDAQILIWNSGTSMWTPESMTGDVHITDLGVTSIVATTNSTLTTLTALSLPGSQVTGNISGNAANVTGIVAIVNGGTGQTTANAAFDALSPMTTLGDIIYENATPTAARLPGNTTTAREFLTSQGTGTSANAPSWSALVSGDIPNNAANTTGTASNITATTNSTLTTLTALTSAPSLAVTGSQVGGFTQGSVIFAGASGTLSQDNANFYWNDTTLALGIGVQPAATAVLDVVNNSGTTKAIQVTGYGSNVGFRGREAGGTLIAPTATASGTTITFFSGRGYGTTGFAGASTGVINIVADATFTDSSMPTHIAFNVTPVGSVTSAEAMRIANTGHVLIGTTTDGSQLLQVNGTALFSGIVTDTVAPIFSSLTGYLYGNGASQVTASTTIPGSAITGNISGDAANVTGIVGIANGGTNNAGPFTAGSVIFSNGTQLTQDNAELFWDNTNFTLGLGTNTPAAASILTGVNITGAARPIQLIGYGTGSSTGLRGDFARGTVGSPAAAQSGDILNFISGRGYGASQFAAASTGVIQIAAAETFTNTSNATYIAFKTTNTGSVTSAEAMRISPAGNLLIGTTTDSGTQKLQVNGNSNVGTVTGGTWNSTDIGVAYGGTGISTIPTNGQLLIGNGTGYTLGTLTAGSGISITNASGSVTITSNNTTALVTKTANYTILSTDGTILCDTSGGAFTLTLPSPTGLSGKLFRVIDSTGFFQSNNLTLAPSGGEKIEGLAASKVLQTPWGWFTITTNGTDWWCG